MADTDSKTTPTPAPAVKTMRELAELWYDAQTVADKKALVAQYPKLKAIFSEAQNY